MSLSFASHVAKLGNLVTMAREGCLPMVIVVAGVSTCAPTERP
jgi:hypothetical protein